MSSIETLIRRNRTCRRFDEQQPIERLQLIRWINIIRHTASGRNIQPLKYIVVTDPEQCHWLTGLMRWAAMLPDWEGPAKGERPTAYLIQLVDTHLAPAARFDEGIQLATACASSPRMVAGTSPACTTCRSTSRSTRS